MDKHVAAYAIEALMKDKGTNAKRLAREAGVGETYIRDILKGRSLDPRINKLASIAEALSCTLEELIAKGEKLKNGAMKVQENSYISPNVEGKSAQYQISFQEKVLLRCYRRFDEAQKTALLNFLGSLNSREDEE